MGNVAITVTVNGTSYTGDFWYGDFSLTKPLPASLIGQTVHVIIRAAVALIIEGDVLILPSSTVDPVGNSVTLAGQDGLMGTDDDLKITAPGGVTLTVDASGFLRVPDGAIVTDSNNQPLTDLDGNDVVVPPGSVVTSNGLIFIPPENGSISTSAAAINFPAGTKVYVNDPPCVLVAGEGPGGSQEPGGTFDPKDPPVNDADDPVVTITSIEMLPGDLIKVTVSGCTSDKHNYTVHGGAALDRSVFTAVGCDVKTRVQATTEGVHTFTFPKPAADAFFFHAVAEKF